MRGKKKSSKKGMDEKDIELLSVMPNTNQSTHFDSLPEPMTSQGDTAGIPLATDSDDEMLCFYDSIELKPRKMSSFRDELGVPKRSGRTFADVPNTQFRSECFFNQYFKGAVGSMQGWRARMEDAHCLDIAFREDSLQGQGFFCVFDGHSGKSCSLYCKTLFPRYAASHYDGEEIDFKKMFLEVDDVLRMWLKSDKSGSTAVAVHVKKDKITCASVGDSRAVLYQNGEIVSLTEDHKPEKEEERRRITSAGGYVYNNRVNGGLAMSRAMGDFLYKDRKDLSYMEQLVIASPRVRSVERKPDSDSFLVLACDGIFDVVSNEEVMEVVRAHKEVGRTNEQICEFLCSQCLAPQDPLTGLPSRPVGTDNMTIMIVDIH